jgi:membrane fusion protein (multidrug efflux system)
VDREERAVPALVVGPRRGVPVVIVSFVLLTLALGAWFFKPWERFTRATGAGAPPGASASSAPAQAPIVVDGVEATPRPMKVTVPAVGALAANESVPIAAELQRRVVRVLAQDGARVKKGDLLFKLDDSDLLAQARELQVRRKLLVENDARQRKLHAEGLSSASDYERAKAELELLDAQVGSLSVTIGRTSVRAPFDGRLGLRNVSEGALVSPNTTLITLQDDSKVKVDFTLPERYASFVSVGRTFSFRVAGKADAVEAKVSAVEPTVDAESRSLRVRGLTENAKGDLMVGGFVTVEYPLESQAGGLLVPAIAIVPSLGGHAVWVAKDGKAALVDVELGVRTQNEVQLISGVQQGDFVITTNLLRLRPGAPIQLGKVQK